MGPALGHLQVKEGPPGSSMDCTISGDLMFSPGHDVLRETPPSITWCWGIKRRTGRPM